MVLLINNPLWLCPMDSWHFSNPINGHYQGIVSLSLRTSSRIVHKDMCAHVKNYFTMYRDSCKTCSKLPSYSVELTSAILPSWTDRGHWRYSWRDRKSREVHSYCRHGLRPELALHQSSTVSDELWFLCDFSTLTVSDFENWTEMSGDVSLTCFNYFAYVKHFFQFSVNMWTLELDTFSVWGACCMLAFMSMAVGTSVESRWHDAGENITLLAFIFCRSRNEWKSKWQLPILTGNWSKAKMYLYLPVCMMACLGFGREHPLKTEWVMCNFSCFLPTGLRNEWKIKTVTGCCRLC